MSRGANSSNIKSPGVLACVIPPNEWGPFLESFGRSHEGWLTRLETKDTVTQEQVVSHESPLQLLELDLEDERNPRINVVVKLDNKIVKHILFLPSLVILRTFGSSREESLEIETLNTETTVYLRPRDDS
jgi:hypothetical protein